MFKLFRRTPPSSQPTPTEIRLTGLLNNERKENELLVDLIVEKLLPTVAKVGSTFYPISFEDEETFLIDLFKRHDYIMLTMFLKKIDKDLWKHDANSSFT